MTDRPDPADVEARLAALADGPAPALPGADRARLRGGQRARRTRAVLGGGGAVAALLAVGAAAALTGGGTAPTSRTDGTLSVPTSPPSRAEGPVVAALLDAEDLERLPGDVRWSLRPTDDAPFPVLPVGCGDGRSFTRSAPRNGDTGTALRYLDGRGAPGSAAGGAGATDLVLGHQVLSFGDEATAAAAFGRLVDAVETCADDGAPTTELLGGVPTTSATRLFGRTGAGAFVVERLGPVVSVVAVQPRSGETVDVALADAAAAEVRAAGLVPTTPQTLPPGDPACPQTDVVCVERPEPPTPTRAGPTGAPSPAPTPAPTRPPRSEPAEPRDLTAAVLTVQDAQRAEPGSWRRDGFADEGPVLDPCPGGTRYPRDADRLGDATTLLSSTREAGGTEVAQQVARYPSRTVAADAAAGYVRAVRGCSTSPEDEPPGGTVTYEVLGNDQGGGAATTYVRRVSTCDTCVAGYTYYAVQQRDDLVSVLLVAHGEDGDPGRDVVVPFARQAAARLAP